MSILLAVLAVWVILALIGFAAHAVWYAAAVVFIAWLAGFAFRSGEGSGGAPRHWYRW